MARHKTYRIQTVQAVGLAPAGPVDVPASAKDRLDTSFFADHRNEMPKILPNPPQTATPNSSSPFPPNPESVAAAGQTQILVVPLMTTPRTSPPNMLTAQVPNRISQNSTCSMLSHPRRNLGR